MWEVLMSRSLQWQLLLDAWPWGDQAFFVVGSAMLHTAFFTGLNLFFFALHKLRYAQTSYFFTVAASNRSSGHHPRCSPMARLPNEVRLCWVWHARANS